MSATPWAIRGRRVVTPDGIRDAAILIEGPSIVGVVRPDEVDASIRVEDAGDLLVLPGLVDTHVHINDPGRADWEGFATATAAAAVGGVTTLVDMPLNSDPVTTSVPALLAKRAAAEGRLRVDCGFFGGLVPGNADQIEPLANAGVVGFKAFLCHSGIDDFPNVTEADLRLAMPILARRGLPLLAHAELVPDSAEPMDPDSPTSYATWLASRPPEWEIEAIRLLIGLCRETGCHVHIVHLAAPQAIPFLVDAQAGGLPLTVETCPHYLTFAAETIPDGDPRFKCAPPIRSESDREALWRALKDGVISTIGTDHSPAPPELKHLEDGDLSRAWGGISSLQLSLPIVWTEARRRGFDATDLARWMAQEPAKLVGLATRKGRIAPGFDADLVLFDPDAKVTVDPARLHHRHPATPYAGRTLEGRVVATYLRGTRIASNGQPEGVPSGVEVETPLHRLNSLGDGEAALELLRCCGSTVWASRMAALRPFASEAALIEAGDEVWREVADVDRLEAFAAHPRIGDVAILRAKYASMASKEQAGVAEADEATLQALAEGNQAYEARFGHIFLVFATGKSAAEMLAILRARVANEPGVERAIASDEQAKITRLRLRKLCR